MTWFRMPALRPTNLHLAENWEDTIDQKLTWLARLKELLGSLGRFKLSAMTYIIPSTMQDLGAPLSELIEYLIAI